MPFDITTAKPVTGFDITTARPVDDQDEVVYREETDSAISASSSLDGREIEYLDNTQNRKIPNSEHFGFSHIGRATVDMLEYPAALFKGAGAAATNIVTDITAGNVRQIGEARKEVFTDPKPYSQMTVEEKLGSIRRRNTPFLSVFGSERDKALSSGWLSRLLTPKEVGLQQADSIIAASKKIDADGKKFLESANFVRQDGAKGVVFDIGGVTTTIGASIGLSVATKNPLAATMLFRDLQKNNIYLEAQEKGWENADADKISTLAGNFEGALEFVGVNYFLKAAEMSKPISRILFRSMEESIQEGTQTLAEEFITQMSALRPEDIEGAAKNIGYSMILGVIGGGGVSTAIEIGDKLGKEKGIPKPVTDKMAEKIVENMPEIETELGQLVADQASPLRDDKESLSKVEKIYADFVAGKEIDVSELSLEDQGLLQEMDLKKSDGPAALKFKEFNEKTWPEWVKTGEYISEIEQFIYNKSQAPKYIEQLNQKVSEFFNQIQSSGLANETARTEIEKLSKEIERSANDNVDADQFLEHLLARIEIIENNIGKSPSLSNIINEIQDRRIDIEGGAFARMSDADRLNRKDSDAGFDYKTATIEQMEGRVKALSSARFPKEEALRQEYRTLKKQADSEIESFAYKPPAKTAASGSGGSGIKPPSGSGPTDGPNPERDYEIVANQDRKSSLLEDTKDVFKDVHGLSGDLFSPVSSRLGRINQKLKHDVRKFVYKTGLYTHEDRVKIKPFADGVSDKMSEQDYRVFDLALKNRDAAKIAELVKKYDIEKEYADVRDVLDNIHALAKDVGIELGFIDDYFPRKVKSGKVAEYIAFMRKQETWSDIKMAMEKADPNQEMNPDEQAEFVNNYLRGYGNSKLQLSKPDNTKARSVDYITAEFNEFYEDSIPTLLQYVGAMRHAIESRKLFGKSETETESNIGAYVLSLVDSGAIRPEQEVELRKLLAAVVEPTGTRGAWAWAKNASYIYLMGNPVSAITQIQDLAFSLHFNGYYRTTKSLLKSLTGNAVLTKEDIGLENILHEFEDNTRAGKAVRKTFDLVGLSWMDNIGKQTFMDAAYARVRDANKKNTQKFNDALDVIFGEESDQVKQDLTDGVMSENVKYLMFSELSDVQPITIAEMPVGYLNGGNGRVFYMLKTYTIKQIDIYRREIFDEVTSGDLGRTAKGMKNLISLATSLMLMGMSSDALKDLLLGREIVLDDLVLDNILKTMAFTKYQIYKAREEGIASAFFMTLVVPPVGAPINDLTKDITKIGFDDKDLKDSEVLGRVPLVGKFYYWWWGGGRAKEDGSAGKFKI